MTCSECFNIQSDWSIRLLLFMYLNQLLDVRWNHQKSNSFSVTNGVKQGGIISTVFFCIYIDNLLEILKISGLGCYVGYNFCGAFGYADNSSLYKHSLTFVIK